MPSVLICASAATTRERLAHRAAGIAGVRSVSTASGGAEVASWLDGAPADLVLLDAGLRDPDPVQTTRMLLSRRPGTAVVLVGVDDDAGLVTRALAAGARGFLRSDPSREDVALALAHAMGSDAPAAAGANPRAMAAGYRPQQAVRGRPVAAAAAAGAVGHRMAPGQPGTAAHPGQRPIAGQPIRPGVRPGYTAASPGNGGHSQAGGPQAHGHVGADYGAGAGVAGAGQRRGVSLSERELQVLHGMCDGKSNAEIGRDLYLSEDTVKTHARRLFRKLGVRDRAHAVAAGFRLGIVS